MDPDDAEDNEEHEAMTISDDNEGNQLQNDNVQQDHLLDRTNGQLLKRKRTSPRTPAGLASSKVDDDEGQLCPICFDSWTTSGSHRLTSLRCGHLFGYSCVKRWLNTQFPYRCPTCNTKAKKTDIRHIYARKLVAVDNSEMVRLNEALETEKEAKRRAELDTASVRLLYQQVTDDCHRLQSELEDLRRHQHLGVRHVQNTDQRHEAKSDEYSLLMFERKLNICEAGQARVFALESRLGVLAISVPSANDLFPGFGIRKVSTVDWRPGQYVPLHSKPVRDLATKPSRFADGYLLSASIDGTVKVTSLSCNVPVVNYSAHSTSSAPLGAWSCCWHSSSSFYFYAGYQNGTVRLYDIRRSDQYVAEILPMGSHAPVVSLQHVSLSPSGNNTLKGIVVGQLDRITFYEEKSADPADTQPHVLHMDGGLSCLHFEPVTEHLLATYRPSASASSGTSGRVRHNICTLDVSNIAGNRSCTLTVKQTIVGGRVQRLLSRSRLLPVDTSLYLIAGDEESKSLCVWDISSDKQVQRVDLPSTFALDVTHTCGQQPGDSGKLLALDQSGKLSVFRISKPAA